MGYTTSTVHGIEVPNSAEANDVPEDIGKVVTALEAGSLVKRLTGAAIAALTAPQKPAGLVVYNTTTSRLQISDGSAFADIETAPTWTSYTCTVTGSSSNPSGVTQDCEYTQIGKVVHVRISVTIPQATKGSGNYEFSLPVTADSTLGPCGSAHRDGVPEYGGFAWLTSTTKCGMAMNGVRITDAAVNTTTVTFRMLLTYQAA